MITIEVSKSEISFIVILAKMAMIGGKSNIYNDEIRKRKLEIDQLVGQLGEWALHTYWHGHSMEYYKSRWYRNQTPKAGDLGSDIIPLNVDVKASLRRDSEKPLESYHLFVLPREFKKDWVYIPAICDAVIEYHDNNTIKKVHSALVHMLGWATAEMLHPPGTHSHYKKPFWLKANELKDLIPIKSLWSPKHLTN